ncbi:MAG: 3-keto-5-aminohexanoate cleavage protein [Clostridiales bacterium]
MASKQQRKIIISAAVTGAIHTPTMSMYLPRTPDDIIRDAVDACKAGAAIVHIHARNEDGSPTTDFDVFGRILRSIKKQCDAVIGITTGGAQGMSIEERFSVIPHFAPEMASCNGGSMNFCLARLADPYDKFEYEWEKPFLDRTWDNVYKNTFYDIEYCLKIMKENGTFPEFELFDYGHMNNIAHFYKNGMCPEKVYLQFVPGVLGGMPMGIDGTMFMIEQAKKTFGPNVQYCTVAGGRRMFRFATMMAINGGNVRVGLEDGLYISPDGTLAKSSAQQVAKIKTILKNLDFEIASPEDARQQLGLKGKNQVNF